MKKFLALAIFGILALAGCERPADVASRNISVAADNFEVMRKIVFVNGITDQYLAVVEGLCSLGNFDASGELSVTCKTGPNKFVKHYLGLSDNVTFFSIQLEDVDVSTYHNRIMFRPQTIIPDIDFQGDMGELVE